MCLNFWIFSLCHSIGYRGFPQGSPHPNCFPLLPSLAILSDSFLSLPLLKRNKMNQTVLDLSKRSRSRDSLLLLQPVPRKLHDKTNLRQGDLRLLWHPGTRLMNTLFQFMHELFQFFAVY